MTLTAAPITSAGRFSPRGPLGILQSLFGDHAVDCFLKARDLPLDHGDRFFILSIAACRVRGLHCPGKIRLQLVPQLVLLASKCLDEGVPHFGACHARSVLCFPVSIWDRSASAIAASSRIRAVTLELRDYRRADPIDR